jgi:hypothetical protein
LIAAGLLLSGPKASANDRPPIIDMHLHASAADAEGPPPIGICAPHHEWLGWDPSRPYGETFMGVMKQPPCANPIWSPMTDQELLARTIEIMTRRHIVGVLSGTPERVAKWVEAAPGRFYPGCDFTLGPDVPSLDSLRALHKAGRLALCWRRS